MGVLVPAWLCDFTLGTMSLTSQGDRYGYAAGPGTWFRGSTEDLVLCGQYFQGSSGGRWA